jgi:hypothetical protein
MKLYDVPRKSRIKVEGLTVNGTLTEEINFYHIDGMYSYCTTDEGNIIHLPATTECKLIKSIQLKCRCKKAQFTRTVDADFNPLCGRCGMVI